MIDKWLKDDHTYMQFREIRYGSVSRGSPHWIVERDVRGRTELGRARHGEGCRRDAAHAHPHHCRQEGVGLHGG